MHRWITKFGDCIELSIIISCAAFTSGESSCSYKGRQPTILIHYYLYHSTFPILFWNSTKIENHFRNYLEYKYSNLYHTRTKTFATRNKECMGIIHHTIFKQRSQTISIYGSPLYRAYTTFISYLKIPAQCSSLSFHRRSK